MLYGLVSRQNVKHLAWGLLPLAVLVVGLIVIFGVPEDRRLSSPTITERGESYMHLQLGQAVKADGMELSSQFTPLSSDRRDQLLNSLSRFRAQYKQSAPQLRVWAPPGSENAQRVARQLGTSLAQLGLGKTVRRAPGPVPDSDAPMVLMGTEKDQNIIRQLLTALSFHLAGDMEVRFDDTVSLDNLILYLPGEPRFTPEGIAYFGKEEI